MTQRLTPHEFETTGGDYDRSKTPSGGGDVNFVSVGPIRPYVVTGVEFDDLKLKLDGALKRIEALEKDAKPIGPLQWVVGCECSQCVSERNGRPEKGICSRRLEDRRPETDVERLQRMYGDQIKANANDYNKPVLGGQHLVAPICNCERCVWDRRGRG